MVRWSHALQLMHAQMLLLLLAGTRRQLPLEMCI
jgi:hypothetical protein